MALSLGEIEAVLKARDELTAVVQKARGEMDQLGSSTKGASDKADLFSMVTGNLEKILGGLSIGAAAKDFIDLGSEIHDLSQKTGLSTTELQRFKFAAEQSGSTVGSVATAVTQLGRRLAGDNDSAVAALETLNLSFTAIRTMAPAQAFEAVADAIRKVPDPMMQSKLAMDLFGRSGADLLPAIKAGFKEAGDEAERTSLVLSEDAVKSMDDLGDSIGQTMTAGKQLIGVVLVPLAPLLTEVSQIATALAGAFTNMANGAELGATNHKALADQAALSNAALKMPDLPTATANLAALPGPLKLSTDEADKLAKELDTDLKKGFEDNTAAAEAHRKKIEELRGEYSGDNLLKSLKDTIEALGGVQGATSLTTTQKEGLRAKVEDLKAIYDAAGKTMPQVMIDLDAATRPLVETVGLLDGKMVGWSGAALGMLTGLQDIGQEAVYINPILATYGQELDTITGRYAGLNLPAGEITKRFQENNQAIGDIISSLPDLGVESEDAALKAERAARAAGNEARTWESILGDVGGAFSDLGAAIGGQAGAMVSHIGTITAAFLAGEDAGLKMRASIDGIAEGGFKNVIANVGTFIAGLAEAWKAMDAATSSGSRLQNIIGGATTGASIGAAFGGIGAGVGLAVGALIGWMRSADDATKQLQALQYQLVQNMGGLAEFKHNAELAGIGTDTLNRALNTKDPKEYEQAVKRITEAMQEWQKDVMALQSAAEGLNARVAAFAESADVTVEGFERMARFAAVTFAGIVEKTGSLSQALEALGPTLDHLIEIQKTLGLEGTTSIDALLRMREVMNTNKDVMDSIDGLTQLMRGLMDAGYVTAQVFNDFGNDASSLFQNLIDRGVDSNTALAMMQPTLQMLWEMQRKFGGATDEATQSLIDQAVAQGLVGQNMRDVNERILDVLLSIAEVFGAKIPDGLKATADAASSATAAVKTVQDAAEDLSDVFTQPEAWQSWSEHITDGADDAIGGIGDVIDEVDDLIDTLGEVEFPTGGEGGGGEPSASKSFSSAAFMGEGTGVVAPMSDGGSASTADIVREIHALRMDLLAVLAQQSVLTPKAIGAALQQGVVVVR